MEDPEAAAAEEDLADREAPDGLEVPEAIEEALVVDPVPPAAPEPLAEELAAEIEAPVEVDAALVAADDAVDVALELVEAALLADDELLLPRDGPVPGMREADTPVEFVQPAGTGPGPPAVNFIAAHYITSQHYSRSRNR